MSGVTNTDSMSVVLPAGGIYIHTVFIPRECDSTYDITLYTSYTADHNTTNDTMHVTLHPCTLDLQSNTGGKTHAEIAGGNFYLFPNPTSGILFLESKNKLPFSLTVYHVAGNVVYNDVSLSHVKQMDTGVLENGFYVVLVETSPGVARISFVVEHH